MRLVNTGYADKEALMAAAKKLTAQKAQDIPLAIHCTKGVLNFNCGVFTESWIPVH
jgi:hypothetical protein